MTSSSSSNRSDAINQTQNHIIQGWDEVAEEYAKDRTGVFGRSADRLVELINPDQGHSLLDVGCGSGAVLIRASERLGKGATVIGIDISGRMLQIGQAISRETVRPMPLFQMDAGQIAFAPSSFDVITCAFSLFQFPSMQGALTEMWRVLKPGGRIGLSNWGRGFFSPVAALQRDLFRKFEIKPLLPNPLTFKPSTLLELLDDSGFSSITINHEEEEYYFADPEEVWAYNMDMGPFPVMLREQLSSEEQTTLFSQFSDMLQNYVSKYGIKSTFHIIYAVAQKGSHR